MRLGFGKIRSHTPIPSALKMSAAASARLPKTPADDEQLKARHLSIANSESEMRTTVPGH